MFPVKAPATSFVLDFLPELTDNVMEFMDGDDLLRLRQVNTVAEKFVAATIHIRTRAVFQNALNDYAALANILDDAGAVIGGAAATHILFPSDFPPPTHLKIYTSRDEHTPVVTHLQSIQGFQRAPLTLNTTRANTVPEGVQDICRLRKGTITIDVVQSTNRCTLLPIASEVHSALFSYVSTRSYGSAYPSLNRQRLSLLNPSRLDNYTTIPDWLEADVAASTELGWTLQVHWEQWAPGGHCAGPLSAGCASAIRAFGDKYSFTGCSLPVRGRSLRGSTERVDRLTAVWWRGGHTCGPHCHSGQDVVVPETRMCLRAVVRR